MPQQNGTLITPVAGNKFALAEGTYTVTVCVPFNGLGDYQLTLSSSVLTFPVPGSFAGGTGAPVCTTAVVQSEADSDDNLGVQATTDDIVSGGSDSTIVIQAISTQYCAGLAWPPQRPGRKRGPRPDRTGPARPPTFRPAI